MSDEKTFKLELTEWEAKVVYTLFQEAQFLGKDVDVVMLFKIKMETLKKEVQDKKEK